jgi:all-trans-retinol dehydrogenase (NAD+)
MGEFQNQKVFITGSGQGIGKETALLFASQGAQIIGLDITKEIQEDTKQQVELLGSSYTSYSCDLSDPIQIQHWIQYLDQSFKPDILILNAGVAPGGPFLDSDLDVLVRCIHINYIANVILLHRLIPLLKTNLIQPKGPLQNRRAQIILLASIAGKFGTEGVAVYSSSKHAIVGLSSALRQELKREQIGVTWICPTMVSTKMINGVRAHFTTPVISPKSVSKAILNSIRSNQREVYVPFSMRIISSILPALLPNFSEWLTLKLGASKGWWDSKGKKE